MQRTDNAMLYFISLLRYFFILIMIVYLTICLVSFGHKILSLTLSQGVLDFKSIKMLLTDGLFTLIVLAIVKTLFIHDGFDYAITFLEIGFVVIIRKLILIETTPDETFMLLTLGIISSIFLLLIVHTHNIKNRWKCSQRKGEEGVSETKSEASL